MTSSATLLTALSTALVNCSNAIASSTALHTPTTYPKSLVDPLATEQKCEGGDVDLPFIDVLAVKSSMLQSYLQSYAATITVDSLFEDTRATHVSQLRTISSAVVKMRSVEKKFDYSVRKVCERGREYAAVIEQGGVVDGNQADKISSWGGSGKLRTGDDDDSESDDGDDDLAEIAKMVKSKPGVQETGANDSDDDSDADPSTKKYQPKKNRSVEYDETTTSRSEKIAKKNIERMRKSEIMDNIRNEFSDRVEETGVDGVSGVGGSGLLVDREKAKAIRDAEKERTDFEEERMVRLVTGRKEKKEKKRLERAQMSVNALADFSSFADGITSFEQEASFGKREKGAQKIEGETGSKRHINGKRIREGDDNLDGNRSGGKGKKRENYSGLQKEVFGGNEKKGRGKR